MTRPLFAPLLLLALGACAANGANTVPPTATETSTTPAAVSASTVPATTGTIAVSEPVTSVAKQGGGAVVAIGASVLGAFIPGPWGSVASVATGQAGRVALDNYDARAVRYTVRMTDGRVETVTQHDPLPMQVGTAVELVVLSNGTKRLVQIDAVSP